MFATSVRLQNLRCFKDTTISLARITALVGANATGKSTVLEALAAGRVLADSPSTPVGNETYRTRLAGQSGVAILMNVGVARPHSGLRALLRLAPPAMRTAQVVERRDSLNEDGSNLVNVFASVPVRSRIEMAERLAQLVPAIKDVDFAPTTNGHHRLRFQDRWTGTWLTPDDVSDGTLLTFAFIVLAYQPQQLGLVAIDEPEQGLHPLLMQHVVDLLRKLSRGELGRPAVQVVLATHSSDLIDCLEPEEVRFLTRDAKTGDVKVEVPPVESPGWQEFFGAHKRSMARVWLSGQLGGVPAA